MVVFESPNSSVGQSNGLIIRRSSVQARLGALLQQAHAPDPKGSGALLFRWLQLEQALRQERWLIGQVVLVWWGLFVVLARFWGYRTFGVVFDPGFRCCGGRNWGFELVCFNCEVGQDVLVEGRVLPVTAR